MVYSQLIFWFRLYVKEKTVVIMFHSAHGISVKLGTKKWLTLCTFSWIQQNISPSLGKIFKCILKVLFGPFKKHYRLCSSELPLAKFQRLKIQDFGITGYQHFFWYLFTISHKQLSPKPINHTILCKNSIISSMCT